MAKWVVTGTIPKYWYEPCEGCETENSGVSGKCVQEPMDHVKWALFPINATVSRKRAPIELNLR